MMSSEWTVQVQASDLRGRRAQWRPAVGLHTPPEGSEVALRTDTQRTEMFTRGSTVRSTIEFLRDLAPDDVDDILESLSAADRKTVRSAKDTDEVPYRVALALWRATDAALGRADPRWIDRSGSWAIEQAGMRLYSGLIRKPSPLEFLTQHISLFHLYYRPGDMVVVDQAPGRAVMRLVGFDPTDTLFCRRLSGGWIAALRIAGGRDVVAVHNRCSLEGDLFCEWELRWK